MPLEELTRHIALNELEVEERRHEQGRHTTRALAQRTTASSPKVRRPAGRVA